MPMIESIHVRVTTAEQGSAGPVRIRFNGFDLALKPLGGSTTPGATFEGSFQLESVGHSCALIGPREGRWDISTLDVTWNFCAGKPPAKYRFGALSLDPDSELDILTAPPPPAFDV